MLFVNLHKLTGSAWNETASNRFVSKTFPWNIWGFTCIVSNTVLKYSIGYAETVSDISTLTEIAADVIVKVAKLSISVQRRGGGGETRMKFEK